MNNYIPSFVDKNNLTYLYTTTNIPVFQNKLYKTGKDAQTSLTKSVKLTQCNTTGIIFNIEFDPGFLNYDGNYQNEQAYSPFFLKHLDNVIKKIKKYIKKNDYLIEIGCGKGFFLFLLKKQGYNIRGFDPAYEGNDPSICRDNFYDKYSDITANFIILRHTLEHVVDPFVFLHTVAKSNNYKGKIYIEVPTFDWIFKNKAIWDIFYEHCNYFTYNSLSNFFDTYIEGGEIFNGQYIYIIADLSSLKRNLLSFLPVHKDYSSIGYSFEQTLSRFNTLLYTKDKKVIWCAGAKGSTFVNIFDPERKYIDCVIDINPIKQNKFMAGTGHPVYSPEKLNKINPHIILVMNKNYLTEIKEIINNNKKIKIISI